MPTTPSDTTALTAQDTYIIHIEALPLTVRWGTVGEENLTKTGDGTITAWTVQIRENGPGKPPVAIRHNDVLAAMRAIITDQQRHRLRPDIVQPIQAVLNAPTNDKATDAIVNLDVVGFDAIIQVAVIGDAVY